MSNPTKEVKCAMEILERIMSTPQEKRFYLIVTDEQEKQIKADKTWK